MGYDVNERFLCPVEPPFSFLDGKKVFHDMSSKEQLYSHYLSRSCWSGLRIVFKQTSSISIDVLDIILDLFKDIGMKKDEKGDLFIDTDRLGGKKEEINMVLMYFSMVLGNKGNYLDFGDTKFIPRLKKDDFMDTIKKSFLSWKELNSLQDCMKKLDGIIDPIYSLNKNELCLGIGENGCSTYFSPDVSLDDVSRVNDLISKKVSFEREKGSSLDLERWNTRLFKKGDDSFVFKIASVQQRSLLFSSIEKDGIELKIQYGDHSEDLKKVRDNLGLAKKFASNSSQKEILDLYQRHFETGDISLHKDASKLWVKDFSPAIETYIGFIENYRDPCGERAEFEGFVAAVNESESKKLAALSNHALEYLRHLPWPQAFEKDAFDPPDFTSLDVLAFATSGIPIGINLPNYDEIRQHIGFKNLSLGSVMKARSSQRPEHLLLSDEPLFHRLSAPALEVAVALHELLGHGSGKLLREDPPGVFNFPRDTLVDPITSKPVSNWYRGSQNWSEVFGKYSNPIEECRAEAVALRLVCVPDVLNTLEIPSSDQDDLIYLSWLEMARKGLASLSFYEPETKSWGQAHSWARFAILKTLLRAGSAFVQLVDEDGLLCLSLDRKLIGTVGIDAINGLLLEINIFKATADLERGKNYFDELTEIDESWLLTREKVLQQKKPRTLMIQGLTTLEPKTETPKYLTFQKSPAGMIASFLMLRAEGLI